MAVRARNRGRALVMSFRDESEMVPAWYIHCLVGKET